MNATKKIKNYLWLLMSVVIMAAVFTITPSTANAQSLRINPVNSSITIYGTSNLHDWDIKIDQISGDFVINNSKQVESLVVKIPVRSIKSGDRLMDRKTYETLDADKNPTIIFQLSDPISTQVPDQNNVQVTLTGNLTVAGVSKKISFLATGKSAGSGAYNFKASIPLKMTDFKMKPPTAMLGMVKAGDVVTLKLDVTILSQNLVSINY